MGTWGPAIFFDDFACDIRDEFRDLLAEAGSASEAIATMEKRHSANLNNSDDGPVFWLAVAATSWKLGYLNEKTKQHALEVISSGVDLQRWEDNPLSKNKRAKVLKRLAHQLQSEQRQPVKVKKRRIAENDWQAGEVVGLKSKSGKWTLLHVTGHHVDRGGRLAVCELLDWYGAEKPPDPKILDRLKVVAAKDKWHSSDFILQEPRKKCDLIPTALVVDRFGPLSGSD